MADTPSAGTPAQWGTPQDHAACGDAIAAAAALGAHNALLSLADEIDAMAGRPRLPSIDSGAYRYSRGIIRGIAEMARRRAQEGPGTPLDARPVSREGREPAGDLSALPPCPTLCDGDCELNPDGCHEEHQPTWKRGHQPHGCEEIRRAIAAAVTAERARLYAELGNEHYVIFTRDGWTTEHSVECRLSGRMSECPWHEAVRRIATESDEKLLGRWRITGITEGLPDLERADREQP